MNPNPMQWAVAGRPLSGELESGDLPVAEPFAGGLLLGAIDGIGHGSSAAGAAREAVAALHEDPSAPLPELFKRCNARLHRSRGAVMTLGAVRTASAELTWGGIGNVEAVLAGPQRPRRESVVLLGGFLGDGAAGPRVVTLKLLAGDVLLFATDGLKPGFTDQVDTGLPVQTLADMLLHRYGRPNDDALVLAARWQP
jgi:negative regulator of sigma-B (phosphoserine phosphatase)